MVTVVSPRVCDICLNFYRKENFAGAQPQLGTGGSCSGLLGEEEEEVVITAA